MGSNNSRLNSEGEAIPAKIRPLLPRRYQEIKNRLSKKQLLKADTDEDDNPQSHCPSQSVGGKELKAVPLLPLITEDHQAEIVVVRSSAEKSSKVVPLPETELHVEEKMNHVYDNSEIVVQTKEEKVTEYEQDDNGNKDDDNEIGRRVCPGSPSFKIYCIEPQKIEEEESKDKTAFTVNVMHQKSASADNVECAAWLNSRHSNRRRKFLAVKNLLKMKSRYHPRSSRNGGSQRTGLIAAKEAN